MTQHLFQSILQLKYYLTQACCWRKKYPGSITFCDLVRYFGRWRQSLRDDRNALMLEMPWLTFAANEYLNRIINSESRVFEWGMGGSSMFFAQNAAEVVSVEHDQVWFDLVTQRMRQAGLSNWQGRLVVPELRREISAVDVSEWKHYASGSSSVSNLSFINYVRTIDEYPDAYFDVVAVDGRARPSCIRHAIEKVHPTGVILVDNAERDYYTRSLDMLKDLGWKCREFDGPGPYNTYFWRTSVWQRTMPN